MKSCKWTELNDKLYSGVNHSKQDEKEKKIYNSLTEHTERHGEIHNKKIETLRIEKVNYRSIKYKSMIKHVNLKKIR